MMTGEEKLSKAGPGQGKFGSRWPSFFLKKATSRRIYERPRIREYKNVRYYYSNIQYIALNCIDS